MDSTEFLVNHIKLAIRKKVEDLESVDKEKFLKIIDKYPTIFQGIETETLHSRYVKETLNYVEYKEIPLGKKLYRRKKGTKFQIQEEDECFLYIPILKSIQQLLGNKRIKNLIFKEMNLSK